MTFAGTRQEADAMPRGKGRKLRVLLLQLSAHLDINMKDHLHMIDEVRKGTGTSIFYRYTQPMSSRWLARACDTVHGSNIYYSFVNRSDRVPPVIQSLKSGSEQEVSY